MVSSGNAMIVPGSPFRCGFVIELIAQAKDVPLGYIGVASEKDNRRVPSGR
jgi:hypothetical protein